MGVRFGFESTRVKPPWSFRDVFRPRNIALGAALAFSLLLYERGPVSVVYFQTKSFCKNKPVLWQMPQDLRLDSRAPETGHLVSQFGVTFSSPWGPATVVVNKGSIVVISFGRKWNMGIFDPAITPGAIEGVKKLPDPPDMAAVFGSDTVWSNFELTKEVLSVTPGQLSLWTEPRRLARDCVFLTLKYSETSGGETGIYGFESRDVRGFQMGNPSISRVVMINAFAANDHPIKLFIAGSKVLKGEITQNEINTVLSTLQLTEEPRPQATVK